MKKYLYFLLILPIILILSGCGTSVQKPVPGASVLPVTDGSLLKSTDGGKTWQLKTKITDQKNLTGVNVLSLAIDPQNSQNIFLGTEKDGLFVSHDGAETWTNANFTAQSVYGLALDSKNPNIVYATGIFNNRGKIFKSLDAGSTWKEIYTEPANGTYLTAVKVSSKNIQLLYAGTNEGVIVKSTDGGNSWRNLYKADAPVIGIAFDSAVDSTIYFAIFERGLLRTKDSGAAFTELKINSNAFFSSTQAISVASDPNRSGIFYTGLSKGLIRGINFGDKFENVPLIESSINFPVRAIAINPQNSNELIYGAAQAIYKSIDGGVQWTTFQLNTARSVQTIKYDPQNPTIIYAGLRKL